MGRANNDSLIANGWDCGLDYKKIQKKFVNEIDRVYNNIRDLREENATIFDRKKRMLVKKLIYLTISVIQLVNGSRVTEAINAFKIFLKDKDFNEKVVVKIGKSDSLKTTRQGEQFRLKPRFRHMKFPTQYVSNKIIKLIDGSDALDEVLKCKSIKIRVCNYLEHNFNCNTHSLRYAFINHLLYDLKVEMTAVAKFVGHVDCGQLVRYSQRKQIDRIFDMDL
jgi:hypothetical protein